MKSYELIQALEEGKVIEKYFVGAECSQCAQMEFFKDNTKRIRITGWASALENEPSVLLDIVMHPENWAIK